jgi:NAD(P)-dependent dehydrogenase (short-subunit alcohol dehydrogenase family)
MRNLRHEVAIVTGASRGAGRAVAAVLGEAGAVVYVTGRSVRGGAGVDGLPGTIEDAAEEVTARGGRGIAVRCDHTVEADVVALVERVRNEQGRLDVLVNNAWGGYEGQMMGLPRGPFWEQPRSLWDAMFVAGVRSTIMTSQLCAPLMIGNAPSPCPLPEGEGMKGGASLTEGEGVKRVKSLTEGEGERRGLIVCTVAWAYGEYLGNLYYDVSKAAVVRMVRGMAQELRPHGVAAVALAPGFMRTERVMAAHAAHPFDLSWTESPEYLGRAVRALGEDSHVMEKSGEVLTVGDLAQEYGFTDVDGRQPAGFRMPKG